MKRLKPIGPTIRIRILTDDDNILHSKLIDIPDHILNPHIASAVKGIVEELSPHAYKSWFDGEPWVEVGDIVFVKTYSGINNPDEPEVRIVEDKDVWAILKEEKED